MRDLLDPSRIDLRLDSRAITFENPEGARGEGGRSAGGRKGAPSRQLEPGERVVLADLRGPGTFRHIWMTFPPGPPELMRALVLEVFYDGRPEPSISVPCLDFFGCPLGRPVAYDSALTSVHEGRGFNAYFPMPFGDRVRAELVNMTKRRLPLYYQIDYTLEPEMPPDAGYLHATFRRENPTKLEQDFVIEQGLEGPGRFLGAALGIRVLDGGQWYGEGEVKVYRDGDTERPTICGTGLEDWVGSAWGMERHSAWYAGVPLVVRAPEGGPSPDFVGLYRWHLPDPIVFTSDLRVTVQQIGFASFREGRDQEFEEFARSHPAAGQGWDQSPRSGVRALGIFERVDDYCATSYVYCRNPQPVPRLDVAAALVDIDRLPYEPALQMEQHFQG